MSDDTAAVAVLLTNAAEHLVHHVTGITDQSVTLSCGAHDGFQLRDVTWSDGVYADDETTKAVIFRSENNAKRQIEEAHPNRANYRIDADFRLTISNLQSTDTGAYICRSTGASGAPHDRLYELSIASVCCLFTYTTTAWINILGFIYNNQFVHVIIWSKMV